MTAKSHIVDPPRRTRTSRVSYPYHTLSTSLELAKGVREIGNGKQEVSRSLLAQHLQVDENSGDFAQKLASAKCYGLIEGRSGFKLTDLAKGIFFPTEDPERENRIGLLVAAATPGAFSALLENYDGSKVPSAELMANVLAQQHGLPESWKLRIAGFFLKAMAFAGALSADGFLRHRAELEKLRNGHGGGPKIGGHADPKPMNQDKSRREKPHDPPADDRENQDGVIVWKYPFRGINLCIETPEGLTRELWLKLKRYIDVLEPTENE